MSNNPLLWKFLLIVAVIAVAAFAAFPLDEKIALGLDLRGGSHILMQVDTRSALKYERDLTQSRIGQALKSAEGGAISYASIVPVGDGALEVRGTDPAKRAEVRAILDRGFGSWDIQSLGAGDFRLAMPPAMAAAVKTNAVDTTKQTINNRVSGLGLSEAMVQKQGLAGDRILIQLPGVSDPERIKNILGEPALLEWKEVSFPPGAGDGQNWFPPATQDELRQQFGGRIPDDTELVPYRYSRPDGAVGTQWWPLKRVSVVMGNDLRSAYPGRDEWGDPAVDFELTQDAGKRFEEATRANINRPMAILLGGVEEKQVISVPRIISAIRDRGQITGVSQQEAEDLALKLRSGAIPTDVRIIEERTVGPSLGRDSIRSGLISGLAGFVGVMLFMLVYYRLSGVNAVIALALNVLLVFGILGAMPFLMAGKVRAALTLPGIAGLILTVGMAVDSNVLIFERIREELRLGKTVRAAVEQGFGKAFMTILDCNVTTLVAALFLMLYGTGPVQGFAVSLTIGLVASMFTAVFVSRQIFELVLRLRPTAETLSI